MTLVQLQYFMEAVVCGSVTGAAKKLGVSQPAVSAQLKLLEKEIKAPLLHKHGGRMRPTEPGRIVFRHATEVFAGFEKFNEEIKSVIDEKRIAGNLSIGCGPLLSRCVMPEVVRQYLEAYPEVNMSIFEEDSTRLPELINEGKVVAGIGIKPPVKIKGVKFRRLFSNEFCVICNPLDAGMLGNPVELEKLKKFPFIGHMPGVIIHEILAKHIDIDALKTIFHARNTETVAEFVKSELGVSLAPGYLLRIMRPQKVVILPLRNKISVEVGIFTRDGGYLTVAHKLFIKTISEKLMAFAV